VRSLPEDLALLQACGEALWGDHWRSALRAQFRVNSVTTRRWMNGEAIVPRTFWAALADHMRERSTRLHDLVAEVDTSLDQR
jgi:hypothetical protein